MPDSVALTALVVSLVALFTTVGQLLQQYLATADGYRRCQASVMGLWSRKTKLRWRWAEFRFETTFVIPRITYGPLHGDVGTAKEVSTGRCSLLNTPESLAGSMTHGGWGSLDARKYYDSDELACWVPLLAQLHVQGSEIQYYFPQSLSAVANDTTVPVIQFVNKSWDFMPTDVVRPMASTTVSDVAIIARRLGMTWKTFDPSTGAMRAEGNGHVITSTLARSLGTILQYTYTTRDNAHNCHYIPVQEADKLGFGLVEFDHKLFGPNMAGDLDVGSIPGISATLHLLMRQVPSKVMKDLTATLQNFSTAVRAGKTFIPGLNDLVPLCSAMLSEDRSRILARKRVNTTWCNRVPAPNLYARGLTSCQEGFDVFKAELRKRMSYQHLQGSRQSIRILELINDLDYREGMEDEYRWQFWQEGPRAATRLTKSEMGTVDLAIKYHAEMTEYLSQSRVGYRNLVGQHIIIASRPIAEDQSKISNTYPIKNFGELDLDLMTGMLQYFESLPELVERVKSWHVLTPPLRDGEVEDAWLSMMFRAFCWQRSHFMIEGVPPLPSEYWNSKMPVYIG